MKFIISENINASPSFFVLIDKPQKPENFSCISYNWENLTCTWDPLYNPIATTFDLSFKIRRQVYLCPTQGPVLHNKCVWSTTTNPLYRQPWENYSFTLNASNFLGNASFSYKVQHYKHGTPRNYLKNVTLYFIY